MARGPSGGNDPGTPSGGSAESAAAGAAAGSNDDDGFDLSSLGSKALSSLASVIGSMALGPIGGVAFGAIVDALISPEETDKKSKSDKKSSGISIGGSTTQNVAGQFGNLGGINASFNNQQGASQIQQNPFQLTTTVPTVTDMLNASAPATITGPINVPVNLAAFQPIGTPVKPIIPAGEDRLIDPTERVKGPLAKKAKAQDKQTAAAAMFEDLLRQGFKRSA